MDLCSPVLFLFVLVVLTRYVLREGQTERSVFFFTVASILLVPIAFVIGGNVFPWYLYPSNWLAQLLVVYLILNLSAILGPSAMERWALVAFTTLTSYFWFSVSSYTLSELRQRTITIAGT